jgi:hypothetical protein
MAGVLPGSQADGPSAEWVRLSELRAVWLRGEMLGGLRPGMSFFACRRGEETPSGPYRLVTAAETLGEYCCNDESDPLPVPDDTYDVAVLSDSISVSKCGKHGTAKFFLNLRVIGTQERFDIVISSHERCLLLHPAVWDGDALGVSDAAREMLLVMPTSSQPGLPSEPVDVHAPLGERVKALEAMLERCDEVPEVRVFEFGFTAPNGRQFRKRLVVQFNARSGEVEGATDGSEDVASRGGAVPRP